MTPAQITSEDERVAMAFYEEAFDTLRGRATIRGIAQLVANARAAGREEMRAEAIAACNFVGARIAAVEMCVARIDRIQ
jgi:hypothetical protein